MVLVCHGPHGLGSTRRERRLWALLCRWAAQEGCRMLEMTEAASRQSLMTGEIPLGVMVAAGMEDLSPMALFRSRFPHGHLVVVVLKPDSELLVAVQRFSPCFVAVTERDDAAIPQVLARIRQKVAPEELVNVCFHDQRGERS